MTTSQNPALPAPPAAAPAPAERRSLALRWGVRTAAIVLGVLLFKLFGADVYGVREQSMWPVLIGDVDHVVVDKVSTHFGGHDRFEIDVFEHDGRYLVKRLIAVGGEIVDFRGGDVFVGADPAHLARAARSPDVVAAQRIPVYPTKGDSSEKPFVPFGGTAVVRDGVLEMATEAPDRPLVVRLRTHVGTLEWGVRDDHLGGDERMIAGRHPVPDVRIAIDHAHVEGGTLACVHQLKGEERGVALNGRDLVVTETIDGQATTLASVPFPGDAGVVIETLDGVFSVAMNRADGTVTQVFRGARDTVTHGAYSAVRFELDHGTAAVSGLAITRDVHYVWPDEDPAHWYPVPPGSLFFVGDNVPVSTDSRSEQIGTPRESAVIGRVRAALRGRFVLRRVT